MVVILQRRYRDGTETVQRREREGTENEKVEDKCKRGRESGLVGYRKTVEEPSKKGDGKKAASLEHAFYAATNVKTCRRSRPKAHLIPRAIFISHGMQSGEYHAARPLKSPH